MTIAFNNTDSITVTDERPTVLELSHEPIPGSLHVFWDTSAQPASEFDVDGRSVTFHEEHVHVGDVIWATYAYHEEE
jgi:hypothetical protein